MSVRAFIRSSTVELWQPELLITYHHYFISKKMIWPINTPYDLATQILHHYFYIKLLPLHSLRISWDVSSNKRIQVPGEPYMDHNHIFNNWTQMNQSNLLVYYLSKSGHLVNQWSSLVHEISNGGNSKPVVSLALKMATSG